MSGGVYDDATGAAGAGSGAGVDRAAAHRMATALSATGVIIEQQDGRIVEVNEAAARFLGYAPGELVGRSYAALCAPDDEVAQIALRLDLFAGERVKDEGMRRYVRKDGRTIECHAAVSVAPGADAAPAVVTVLQTDAGAESAESQHAKQRLNMLGLFAAGIAHDFNNVLSIIRCNSEFARDALDGQAPDVRAAVTDLLEVERAAERASGLVRQLLAFAGRQARHPQHLDVNEVVRDAATFLRVSIGNEIQVVLRLAPTLPPVLADRSQLDQVLMNLVFNARDAIVEAQVAERGRGGAARPAVLTIATAVEYVGAAAVANAGVPDAGQYVRIDVRDTGAGMSEETRGRIFEPFFTTKPVGGGTGLGLAATWGIVVQSGGSIRVESERQQGSTFRVYLPAASVGVEAAGTMSAGVAGAESDMPAEPRVPGPTSRLPDGGARTVLLAEDDHAVRRVASRILRAAGYRVLEAGDGASARELWEGHGREIDVLVADVRMPRLRGDALAALLAAQRPGLPVVLMTGFGDEPSGLDADGGLRGPLAAPPPLAKPFPASALLERVSSALDGSPTAQSDLS